MNTLIKAANDVLNCWDDFKGFNSTSESMNALRQALELPKQEPVVEWQYKGATISGSAKDIEAVQEIMAHEDAQSQVPVAYVPMSKEEHLAIAMQCMGADNWQQEAMEAVELAVVARMKEQGLV